MLVTGVGCHRYTTVTLSCADVTSSDGGDERAHANPYRGAQVDGCRVPQDGSNERE
jgi:hypothetical protein